MMPNIPRMAKFTATVLHSTWPSYKATHYFTTSCYHLSMLRVKRARHLTGALCHESRHLFVSVAFCSRR